VRVCQAVVLFSLVKTTAFVGELDLVGD
jgi:hypothetical protein